MAVLVKAPERIRTSAPTSPSISRRRSHRTASRAQVVTFDRESCLLYKEELDKLLPPEARRS